VHVLAGNAKNGMRSPNDLLRSRSCPSHNENAIGTGSSPQLTPTMSRCRRLWAVGGEGDTSQVQGDMSSSSDKNIRGRKPVVNHFILTDP